MPTASPLGAPPRPGPVTEPDPALAGDLPGLGVSHHPAVGPPRHTGAERPGNLHILDIDSVDIDYRYRLKMNDR